MKNFNYFSQLALISFSFVTITEVMATGNDGDEIDVLNEAFARLRKQGHQMPHTEQIVDEAKKVQLERTPTKVKPDQNELVVTHLSNNLGYDLDEISKEEAESYLNAGRNLVEIGKRNFNDIDLQTAIALQRIYPIFTAEQFKRADTLYLESGNRNFTRVNIDVR